MATTSNAYALSPRNAIKQIQLVMEAGLVPFLRGSPGVGKSAIVKKIAAMGSLKVIDHRLSTSSPEDLSGLPRFDTDGKARFSPFADLFPLAGEEIPAGFNGWLVFLDEFNSAHKDVQAAAYKLILDRMVGQHHLHPNVWIVCAGNKDTDRAIVNPLSTAMASRVIHLELNFNFKEWMEDVVVGQKWHPAIYAFLSQIGEGGAYDFNPSNQEQTFCCPRTWEFVNKLMLVIGDDIKLVPEFTPAFAGAISAATALQFVTYTGNFLDLPKIPDIIKDPIHTRLPNKAGERYAIASMCVANAKEETFDSLLAYCMRLEFTFQLLFIRAARLIYPGARTHESYREAALSMKEYLSDE